jgi:hypothetical protein
MYRLRSGSNKVAPLHFVKKYARSWGMLNGIAVNRRWRSALGSGGFGQ